MEAHHRILLLDDDGDWLDMCREFLARLPSKPEIHTANSGMRALALLDAQAFRVLLCDLKMPRMDGLQVLSIVRRRFPELRTVVLTSLADAEFRSRAYALGTDLFWLKADMQEHLQLFLDCIESLLGAEGAGFRDVRSKNLLDVIRMELAFGNTSVLRITSGRQVAQIWIQDGQIIDAQAEGTDGEEAFGRILKWKTGAFDSLPGDTTHVRTINRSLEALLLESAQALGKAQHPNQVQETEETKFIARLTALAYEGAEFVVNVPAKPDDPAKGWGVGDVDQLAGWVRQAERAAGRIQEKLHTGRYTHIAGHNSERHLLLLPGNSRTFVTSWPPEADGSRLFEPSKKLAETWAS
jgi:CheY-like chemotaxis protein